MGMNRQQRRKTLKQGKRNIFSEQDILRFNMFKHEQIWEQLRIFYLQNNCNNLEKAAIERELKRRGVL
jgi:hypothetical protein